MDRPIINTLGLCTGAGMLEIGVALGLEYLGYRSKIAALCEWEAYASACLLARMEEKTLEPAPIWSGDLADFPAKSFRGLVDLTIAGFPCQPWSHAGKQEGTADERWIWPEIVRILRDTESSMGFFENVPGLISGGGLHYVLDDLAEMGFHAEWCCLSAESVGASHRRQRVFILAYKPGAMADALRAGGQFARAGRKRVFNDGQEVADTASIRRGKHSRTTTQKGPPDARPGNTGELQGRLEGCDSELAIPQVGGLGKLRESSGRGGQPECGNETLVNSGCNIPAAGERGLHGETIDPAGGETGNSELRRSDLGNADEQRRREQSNGSQQNRIDSPSSGLGDAEHGKTGHGGSREESEAAGGKRRGMLGPSDASGTLADAKRDSGNSKRLRGGNESEYTIDRRSSSSMANPQQQGPQRDGPGKRGRGSESVPRHGNGSILPLFAPGPAADWSEIPAHLWPAVEPGVCLFSDELALVVDESRADQLRCGGNGVVPSQAALAFVVLMQRAFGK